MPTIASVSGSGGGQSLLFGGGISLSPAGGSPAAKRTISESSDPAEIEAQIAKRLKSGGEVAELQNYYYATLPGDEHVSSQKCATTRVYPPILH